MFTMSAKEDSSSRRRSRPVTKPSVKTKMKRNKNAMFLSIFIVLMLVFSGIYVVFSSFGNDESVSYKNDPEYKAALAGTNYPVAVIESSMGAFAIELYNDKVPITAGNFINLAKSGYYDGLIFHRVIKDFMIQGGDPKGDGTGGHAYEYHEGLGNPNIEDTWMIPDEFHDDLSNVRGTISMANAGENTGSSQFFINVVDNLYLDFDNDPRYKHAVFGSVIYGMDVVDEISKVDTQSSNNKPKTDVVMNKVIIIE